MGAFWGGGFEVMFLLVFCLILVMFVVGMVQVARGISQWNQNNHAPRLTVEATVVSKRSDVSHHHHHGENHMVYTTTSTIYYVTFQVESGDRLELRVDGCEFGMLVEGDHGKLSFQGTRYLSFQRM